MNNRKEKGQTIQWPKEKKMKRKTAVKKIMIDQHEPYQTKTIIKLKTRHHVIQ